MMDRRHWLRVAAGSLCAGLHSAGAQPVGASREAQRPVDAALEPPSTPREFRAAWVATVANIDWPSRAGLPPQTQRAEVVALLDRAREIGLNALIFQVRPSADALYPSALEPWSEYLTGAQGRAPDPAYDPLEFWVEQAHHRGLELHAWFNPYRARHTAAKSAESALHLSKRQPDLVKRYGDWLWMDPGEPKAAEHTLAVVSDVVRRYDVDGVHIDDYFYPYPVQNAGAELPFPDDASWQRYVLQGGSLSRDAWRRDNVDRLVKNLHDSVKSIKPWVRVGISPFGLGRPDRRPPGISGFSQYDKLFADVERWLEAGWLDYLAPQLYWPIDRKEQAFGVLLDYWIAQNKQSRHVWPGLFTSRVGAAPQPWPASEVVNQISMARSRAASTGQVHFSMAALMKDADGIATALKNGPYAQPALVPSSPWMTHASSGTSTAAPPVMRLDGTQLRLQPGISTGASSSAAFVWTVWTRRAQRWQLEVLPARQSVLPLSGDVSRVVVRAVDRWGRESAPTVWSLS
ncbi:MAG: hypothetical protein EBS16_01855 [Betaproteobacteria bacterium]|jgi:uncharacterized lipoprotein YddW (UPF0748 family)|nr:hypothetical protein [Betaproteobacteria bacterium]